MPEEPPVPLDHPEARSLIALATSYKEKGKHELAYCIACVAVALDTGVIDSLQFVMVQFAELERMRLAALHRATDRPSPDDVRPNSPPIGGVH